MADEFGADDSLLEAMAAVDPTPITPAAIQQPRPQKIQQPTPQRLNKASSSTSTAQGKVVQPTPQALPKRHGASSLLVSPCQRGNPVLTHVKKTPWEYCDIAADYVFGATTCGLFLSLKYHLLHPEYVYRRIRNLQGKYNLRILLTLVDVTNHEDSLRELSKTSMVNNVTVICCWSAAEAAHYLELYKSHDEHAKFDAIRGKQSSSYTDRLVEFVTVPRSLNKTDAVALVANFGSLRNGINADAEQLGMLSGWGGVKVKRWTTAIDAPFRTGSAAKRMALTGDAAATAALTEPGAAERATKLHDAVPLSRVPAREMPDTAAPKSAEERGNEASTLGGSRQFQIRGDTDDDDDSVEASVSASVNKSVDTVTASKETEPEKNSSQGLSDGVAAALAKLRG